MESLPVESIAHIISYLPFDARRYGTFSRKFGKAYRLYHWKTRIPVDIIISEEHIVEGALGHRMKLQISTKDGSVTLEVNNEIIEIAKNTDAYTIEFCKSFFSLAEICGLLKPTYKQFLTDFVPLIRINSLTLNYYIRFDPLKGGPKSLTTLFLDALRKKLCDVKTITYSQFPLDGLWFHLFDEGRRPPIEDRVRLICTNSSGGMFNAFPPFNLKFNKYATFGVEVFCGSMLSMAVMDLIVNCYHDARYADGIVILKEKTPFDYIHPFGFQLGYKLRTYPAIRIERFHEFEAAGSISELPLEFEVHFTDKGRGLDGFLEIADEGAIYRFVSKSL